MEISFSEQECDTLKKLAETGTIDPIYLSDDTATKFVDLGLAEMTFKGLRVTEKGRAFADKSKM